MHKPELRLPAPLTCAAPPRAHRGRIARQLRASTALRLLLQATAWSGVSISVAMVPPANANPVGGTVVGGQAAINQADPNRTVVTQATDRAAINWQSFSIGANQYTVFQQPSAASVALNRVTGPDPSTIAGHLQANGNIVLVNPNGVVFSQGSQVNVHGLVATTSDIQNSDFMAGRFNFNIPSPNPDAKVVNQGTITVADQGLAALVAPGTENSGVINAKFGRVMLAGAQTFTVDLYGDGLLSFDVTSKVKGANVANSGEIHADGGVIQLQASAADDIITGVVNLGGLVSADTLVTQTGTVIADAGANGQLNVTGRVEARGANAGEAGGSITLTGGSVAVTGTVDASGSAGGGTIKVGGGFHGTDASVANAQTTTVATGATLDASAVQQGNGGSVVVWSDQKTSFAGAIRAKGGAQGGNGGKAEVSSKGVLAFTGTADLTAPYGKWGTLLLDPSELDIIGSGTETANVCTGTSCVITDGTSTSSLLASTLDGLLSNATVTLGADKVDFQANVAGSGTLDVNATNTILLDAGKSITSNGGPLSVNFSITGTGAGVTGVALGSGSSISTGGGSLSIAAGVGALSIKDNTVSLNTTGAPDGNLSLTAPSLALTGTINAGAGTLTLTATDTAATGTIGEDHATITAGILTGSSGGTTNLSDAHSTNAIADINNFAVANNDFNFTGTVALGIDGALSAPGTLTLNAPSITEKLGGTVTAGTLTGATTGNASLAQAGNAVATLGNFDTGTGNFTLTDGVALTVAGNVTTGGGDISLTAPGPELAITGTLKSGAGKTTLAAPTGTALLAGAATDTNPLIPPDRLLVTDGSLAQITATGGVVLATDGADIFANGVTAHTGFKQLTLNGNNIAIDGGLAVGTTSGTLDLIAAGTITENTGGAITAATLTGSSGLDMALFQSGNAITTLGSFNSGGSFFLADSGPLTVAGPVSAGNTLLLGAGSLKLTGDLSAGALGLIATNATGTINQTGGTITAATLAAQTSDGNVTLTGANNAIGALNFVGTGSGNFSLVDTGLLTVNGPVTTTGNLSLTSGSIALAGQVSAGQLSLAATDPAGTITETGSAIVSATSLTGSSGGSTLLTGGNTIGTLADFSSGADLNLNNASALDINGAVTVTGTLTLTAGVITQSGGSISADTLIGTSNGGMTLGLANHIANLGPFGEVGSGILTLKDAESLNVIGPVSATSPSGGVTLNVSGDLGIAGNISAVSVGLSATGAINQTAGTISGFGVTLDAGGAISQTGGAIDALTVSGTSHGNVTLDQSDNQIFGLTGFTTGGGNFSLTDSVALNVTAAPVATASGDLSLTVPGLTLDPLLLTALDSGSGKTTITALNQPISVGTIGSGLQLTDANLTQINAGGLTLVTQPGPGHDIAVDAIGPHANVGDVTLQSAGDVNFGPNASSFAGGLAASGVDITVGGNLSVSTTLALNATGAITQSTGTTISAATLTGSSGGDATLFQSGNAITTLGTFTSGGNFFLLDNGLLTVAGPVNATNILLLDAGSLKLTGDLSANELVLLATDPNGPINQTAGKITAATLASLSNNGDVTLKQPNNAIGALDSFFFFGNQGSSSFTLVDTGLLTVNGPVSTAGKLSLTSGSIALAGSLSAGGQVSLTTADPAGTISETTGTIGAASLTGSSGGSTLLTGGNTIATLGDFASGGDLALNNLGALAINGTVTVPGTLTLTTTGAITQTGGTISAGTLAGNTGGAVALAANPNAVANLGNFTAGSFTLDDGGTPLNVTGAVTVPGTLTLDAGSITEQAGGTISAGALAGTSGGDVLLAQPGNAVSGLGTFTLTGGGFALDDGGAALAVNGALTVPGTLTLNAGSITENVGGTITAHTLTGSSASNALFFNNTNLIAELGPFAAGGSFVLFDGGPLAVNGAVAAGTSSNSILGLVVDGNLALNNNLSAGDAVVLLAQGTITQTAGTITTDTLLASSQGGASLTQLNDFSNLAGFANTGGGAVTINDDPALTLSGTLSNPSGSLTITAERDIVADNVAVTATAFALRSGGSVTLNGGSFSGSEKVLIGAGGSVMQTGFTAFTAPLVVVDATGAPLSALEALPFGTGKQLVADFQPGPLNGNIALDSFWAPSSSVLLAANAGRITAESINAHSLGVLASGGSAQLFGTVGGIAGPTAAQRVAKSGLRDNAYRMNQCAIGSITCIAMPAIVPAKPASLDNIAIIESQQQFADPTIDLLNVGTEDLLSEERPR